MKIPLSTRLAAACRFVKPGDRVADIGCDHGYLGIYLLKNNIASHVIASDINEGPLNAAVFNAEKFGVRDRMQFYLSDGFHDYPPGYVYIMWVLGGLKSLFGLREGALWWAVLKLPSIIADLGMGYLAYKVTSLKFTKKAGSIISAFIVFNPVVIFNGCIWGQVDSVLAVFCALAVYFIAEKNFAPSFFAFGAAILIKPQAIFFAPVLLFGVIEEIFINRRAHYA